MLVRQTEVPVGRLLRHEVEPLVTHCVWVKPPAWTATLAPMACRLPEGEHSSTARQCGGEEASAETLRIIWAKGALPKARTSGAKS